MAHPDPIFGLHPQALTLHRQRLEVLSANIANADTPGYQAKDIDFASALAAQQAAPLSTNQTQTGHQAGTSDVSAHTVFRVPLQPALDGNTVELQVEQAKFAEAALHYKASLSFMDGKLKTLLTAFTGQ